MTARNPSVWKPYQPQLPNDFSKDPLLIARGNLLSSNLVLMSSSAAFAVPSVGHGWAFTNSFTRGEASPGTVYFPTRKYWYLGSGITTQWVKAVITWIDGSSESAPPLTFSDDFNRADEVTLAGNWTTPLGAYTPLALTGNVVHGSVDNSDNIAYVNTLSMIPNQYAQVTMLLDGDNLKGGGPCVTMSASGLQAYGLNVYNTDASNITLEIFRLDTMTGRTVLATTQLGHEWFDPGHVYRIEIRNGLLTAKIDGGIVFPIADTVDVPGISGDRGGMYAYGNSGDNTYDDFECGELIDPFAASDTRVGRIAYYFSEDNETTYVPMLDRSGNYVATFTYDVSEPNALAAITWGNTP